MMSEEASPTDDDAAAKPPPLPGSVARWRWWLHLILLTSYPLLIGLMSLGGSPESLAEAGPAIPPTVSGLITVSVIQLVIFGLLFGAAVFASRPSLDQLYLRWKGGLYPVLRGLAYSIALRILIAVVAILVAVALSFFIELDAETAEGFRPKVEALVEPEAISGNVLYLILSMTLISFIVAGLREELWRAGMLAALQALFPKKFGTVFGAYVAVAMIAVVFGLGHLAQGWAGVAMTAILGLGLGAIMVFHRSIWDAVLAHGFFNASTFLFLYVLMTYFREHFPQWIQ